MKVHYISPIGHSTPMLFDTMVGMEATDNVSDCDCVFFDLHTRQFEYDTHTLNKILVFKEKPICIFDFWDYGGCQDETSEWLGKDNWRPLKKINTQWATFIKMCLHQGRKVIWFVRKYDKTENYEGQSVYPIELVMYPDHVFTPTTKEELFNRPIDITFIGNTSPTRHNVIEALKKTDIALNISFTNETGKFDHPQWLDLHEMSKLFLSCCGGGMSDERAYQLMYISPMLRVKNNQLIVHNFRDGLDCIEISEHPTFDEINYLKKVLNDEELLYSIYLSGITRMEKYFNPEYRANYILKTLQHQGIC